MKWFIKAIRHYADFGGRVRRKEFWYFVLFNFIAAVIAVGIDSVSGWEAAFHSKTGLPDYGPCSLTYALAALLPALAVAVRRLHDLGKSAWWLLVGLIPFAGGIWLLILFCSDGQNGQNRYGANPKSAEWYFPGHRRRKSIAIAFIVGAAATLSGSMSNWIQHNVLSGAPLRFWLFPALTVVLMLLFGVFYHPAGDSAKTANRKKIAFILLAIAALIPIIQVIPALTGAGSRGVPGLILADWVVRLLLHLVTLALAMLLLLKSERKNITSVSGLIILFTAIGIVIQLVKMFVFHDPRSFGIILDIAVILLATYYLHGEAAEEEGASSATPETHPLYKTGETVVYQPSSPAETAGSPPRGGAGKSLGWKILGLFVSIGLIIGGLSGELVLRGIESSAALVVVGILFLIADIASLATHNKSAKKKKEYEQLLAENAISSVELAEPATIMVMRDSSFIGSIVPYKVYLNHNFIGKISNGKSLEIKTFVSHNIITVFDNNDNAFSGDFTTNLEPGGYAEVHVKAGRFVKDKG